MTTSKDGPCVASLHISPTATGVMLDLPEVQAVPGLGLEGDRYYLGAGTFFAGQQRPDAEVTLVEFEKFAAFNQAYRVELHPRDLRRNIVTQGVSLNELVEREFTVGSVRLRGIRLCEPCGHLAQLTCRQVLHGLVHRGGLRAQILTAGLIRVGDAVGQAEVVKPGAGNGTSA